MRIQRAHLVWEYPLPTCYENITVLTCSENTLCSPVMRIPSAHLLRILQCPLVLRISRAHLLWEHAVPIFYENITVHTRYENTQCPPWMRIPRCPPCMRIPMARLLENILVPTCSENTSCPPVMSVPGMGNKGNERTPLHQLVPERLFLCCTLS
jgi:hypothetical protein